MGLLGCLLVVWAAATFAFGGGGALVPGLLLLNFFAVSEGSAAVIEKLDQLMRKP